MTPIWLHRSMGAGFDAVEAFIAHKVWGRSERFLGDTALAVVGDESLIAGVMFHNYSPENGVIELSAGALSPRWLTRPILKEMFSYPFDQLGVQAIIARVSSSDRRLGRILPAYGFETYIIPRLRGRDEDEAIYILYDNVWRENGFHREKCNG